MVIREYCIEKHVPFRVRRTKRRKKMPLFLNKRWHLLAPFLTNDPGTGSRLYRNWVAFQKCAVFVIFCIKSPAGYTKITKVAQKVLVFYHFYTSISGKHFCRNFLGSTETECYSGIYEYGGKYVPEVLPYNWNIFVCTACSRGNPIWGERGGGRVQY
jgi:hypothetical protein